MQDNNYIIEGGAEGKKRLAVLSDVLRTHTQQLIEQDGPVTGKRFLDIGCGGGNLSMMVAGMVGVEGYVTGVDFDSEIIQLAQKEAHEKGITNVTFRALDAMAIDYDNDFDIVYTRFLLSHLTDPAALIQKMIKALKPGGRLIVEDIDFSGHFCYPASRDFDLYLQYFVTAARNNGQNPNIGLALYSMLKDTALHNVQFGLVQPAHHTGDGKWMGYHTMCRIKDNVIKQGLATADEIATVLTNLEAFTKDENTIISLPRVFRAWGYK